MSRKFFNWPVLVLGLGVASAGAFAFYPAATQLDAAVAAKAASPVESAPVIVDAPASRIPSQGFADVVARVTPAVVTIRTERTASAQMTQLPDGFPWGDLFGQRGPRGRQMPAPMQRGLGSGVIMTADGYILTNHHVIEDASKISVELSDRRVLDGKLVGSDPPSDLAVIKVDGFGLPVVPLGDSTAMRVGDLVLAVGNPLGVGQTVTMGIVSAKGRATGFGNGSYEDFLQTDAPINQGNSGGALVNASGELVGINSQILSPSGGNIGIGFAVPSNMAKNVMDQLVVHGRVHRGLLGVTVQGVTGDLAAGLGLDKAEGALVSDVTAGGAAAKAGIRRGDVILKFQGRPVVDTNTFRNEVAATKPGSPVALTVLRDGKTTEITAKLDEMTSTDRAGNTSEGEREGSAKFGMTVDRDDRGVVITDLDPSGAAAAAGLREGDVIEQVNGRPVRSASDLRDSLSAAKDKPAVLLVTRGESSLFVAVRAR